MIRANNESVLYEEHPSPALPKGRAASDLRTEMNTFQPRSEPLTFLIVLLRALSAWNV